MKARLSVLLLSAALVTGAAAVAQPASRAAQIDGVLSPEGIQPAPQAPTTLRMRGTIEKYDASTRTLLLTTANGTVQFDVASTARVRQGRQRIDGAAFEKLAGYRAAVRYSESGGTKTVESVDVFGRNERTK